MIWVETPSQDAIVTIRFFNILVGDPFFTLSLNEIPKEGGQTKSIMKSN